MILVYVIDEEYVKISEMVIKVFKVIDGLGFVRVDFFLIVDGEVLINEVNIMSGFIFFSMFLLFWKEVGVEYVDLIEQFVEFVKECYVEK